MRIDAFDFVVAKVESLETREVLAEVTIQLRDAVTLQVEHQEMLERLALEPEGFWYQAKPSIFQKKLFF